MITLSLSYPFHVPALLLRCCRVAALLFAPLSLWQAEDDEKLFALIAAGDYSFDGRWWDHVTAGARQAVSKMLLTNPAQRPRPVDLLNSDW
jgi:hypothetical protein